MAKATQTLATATAPAAPRVNAHGIGKAYTGPTSTSRMSVAQLQAYQAYLQSVATPNARQQRHLARCTKYLAAHAAAAEAAEA